MNRYHVTAGPLIEKIGEYTDLSNARRAARRHLDRSPVFIEGRQQSPLGGWETFMVEEVEPVKPRCPSCRRGGGPRHEASSRCESGRRPHCSCDVCW